MCVGGGLKGIQLGRDPTEPAATQLGLGGQQAQGFGFGAGLVGMVKFRAGGFGGFVVGFAQRLLLSLGQRNYSRG